MDKKRHSPMVDKLSAPHVVLLTGKYSVGGIRRYCDDLSETLAGLGHQVSIISVGNEASIEPAARTARVRILPLRIKTPQGTLRHLLGMARFLAKMKPDVILLNHCFCLSPGLALLPRKTRIVPVLHTDYEVAYRKTLANPLNWNVAIAPSPGIQRAAQAYCQKRPVICIPHGVHTCALETLTSLRAPHRQDPFRLCYVGRIEQQKGVLLIPEILAATRQQSLHIHCTFIGDGDARPAVEKRVAELDLQKHVTFLGMVQPDKIADYLFDQHVLLAPSNFEGFGLTIVEAQSCGCVPVASHLPGVTDFTVNAGDSGFLVSPRTPPRFAEAIAKLYHDPDLWSHFSHAGWELVKQKFSLERMGLNYRKLVQDLLADCYPLPLKYHSRVPISPEFFFSAEDGIFPSLARRAIRRLQWR
ncbi:MAG: glycosyltransferase family 4 protein [Lentisphaeria bacterium]